MRDMQKVCQDLDGLGKYRKNKELRDPGGGFLKGGPTGGGEVPPSASLPPFKIRVTPPINHAILTHMQTHTAYPPLPAEFARDGNFTGTAAAVLFAAAYWYVIVRPSEQ